MADTEVLIVGAGPVGLTLAVDLGMKGIKCTLIEQKEAPQFLPKMERCNARTMEIYRRMGLADKIRAAGLDQNVPMDVYIILAMNEPPLLRLSYPSVAESLPSVTVRYGCEFISLSQDESGVTAQVKDLKNGASSIRASYLVGCD